MIQYDNNIVKLNSRMMNYPGYAKPSEIEGLMFETDGFDKSSMFQNIEGTIPVGEGDPVRRMNAGEYYFATPSNERIGGIFESNALTFYNNNPLNVSHDALWIYPAVNGLFTDGLTSYTMFTLDVLQDSGSGNSGFTTPYLYISQIGQQNQFNGFRISHAAMGIPQGSYNNLNFSAPNVSYTQMFFNTVRYNATGRLWEGWQNGRKTVSDVQTFEPFSTTHRFRILYRRTDTLNYYRKHYKLLLYNRALSDEEVMLVNNYLGIIKNSHL